ncbi:hypothetical protein [Tissierella sp.]|uniref:hypothetical protein n=1 Tax=Tissierella sp. TaxID=41274 RepID=UPI00302121E9
MINNKQRQQLLQKLMDREMERLRKKCFKYKRRPFLYGDIEIIEEDLTEIQASGLYKKIELNKYKIKHKISIDIRLLDDYFNYKYNKWDSRIGINKKYYKNRIIKVIRHELAHAFVEERYEHMFSKLENKNSDGSPIFLIVLYWMDGYSNHNCVTAFKKSNFYKDTKIIKTFNDLDNYVFDLLYKYDEVTRELEKINNYRNVKTDEEFKEIKDVSTTINSFRFAHRKAGLNKNIEHKTLGVVMVNDNDKKVKRIFTSKATDWEIGCCVEPENIRELYNKKADIQRANLYKDTKELYIGDIEELYAGKIKKITLYEHSNIEESKLNVHNL